MNELLFPHRVASALYVSVTRVSFAPRPVPDLSPVRYASRGPLPDPEETAEQGWSYAVFRATPP